MESEAKKLNLEDLEWSDNGRNKLKKRNDALDLAIEANTVNVYEYKVDPIFEVITFVNKTVVTSLNEAREIAKQVYSIDKIVFVEYKLGGIIPQIGVIDEIGNFVEVETKSDIYVITGVTDDESNKSVCVVHAGTAGLMKDYIEMSRMCTNTELYIVDLKNPAKPTISVSEWDEEEIWCHDFITSFGKSYMRFTVEDIIWLVNKCREKGLMPHNISDISKCVSNVYLNDLPF